MLRILLSFIAFLMPLSAAYAEEQTLAVRWSYDGPSDNMDEWGKLSPAYAKCTLGLEQSPVQLRDAKVAQLPVLATLYGESSASIRMRNYTIDISVGGDNTLDIGGHSYKLTRILFHSPSEHVIQNLFFEGEAQFVHEDAKGAILILSALLIEGETSNAALGHILAKLPADKKHKSELRFDPSGLLPQKRGYFAYNGSLSTPPCTEGVLWRVLKEPVVISKEQLEQLIKPLGRNARLTQPLYTRTILQTQD